MLRKKKRGGAFARRKGDKKGVIKKRKMSVPVEPSVSTEDDVMGEDDVIGEVYTVAEEEVDIPVGAEANSLEVGVDAKEGTASVQVTDDAARAARLVTPEQQEQEANEIIVDNFLNQKEPLFDPSNQAVMKRMAIAMAFEYKYKSPENPDNWEIGMLTKLRLIVCFHNHSLDTS